MVSGSRWITLVRLAAVGLCLSAAPLSAAGSGGSSPGPYELSIESGPPPIGRGEIVVHVRDRATGLPPASGTLIAKAFMPSMPMGETFHQASPDLRQSGTFRLPWSFQMAGDWTIQAEFRGPRGVSDAAVDVSPGSFAFPMWAEALLGVAALGAVLALLNFARTPNGRERLGAVATAKNLVALLVLAVIAIGAWLAVRRARSGQVDWNRMSMQMQDYSAPAPVSVQPAAYGAVSGEITYAGTVVPFLEDTVYSRVTGRVVQAPYAGDHVSAGEVVARLEEPDLVAKADQARFAAASAAHDVLEAQDRAQQARDAVATARAAEQASGGGVQEAAEASIGAGGAVVAARGEEDAAVQDRQAALSDLNAARSGVLQAQAALRSARADSDYWQQEMPREANLLSHGAVSQDEYQGELAKSQAAAAAVDSAAAQAAHAEAAVTTAQAHVAATSAKIRSLRAGVAEARAAEGSQGGKVIQAKAAEQSARAGLAAAATGVTLAAHQVSQAIAMLDQARAARAEAEANLGYLTIRSPGAGVVTQRLADPGTVVSPGTAILKIARIDRVRLQAAVSATDLDKIHVGTPVTAAVQGIDRPINAWVTDVFPSANETTRTATVEAVVPNPGGLLLPGAFVTLRFHTAVSRRALVVPLGAVVSLAQTGEAAEAESGGSGVWTAINGTAHLAPVTTGASDGTNEEILSGLSPGEPVIVGGIEGLTEGAPITYPGMPQLSPTAGAPAPAATTPTGLTQTAGDLKVTLDFDPSPPRAGNETLRFTVIGADSAPVSGARVQVTTEMPSMSMSGPSGLAIEHGKGVYSLPITMGMGADWRVTAAITPPGSPPVRAVFNFKVK